MLSIIAQKNRDGLSILSQSETSRIPYNSRLLNYAVSLSVLFNFDKFTFIPQSVKFFDHCFKILFNVKRPPCIDGLQRLKFLRAQLTEELIFFLSPSMFPMQSLIIFSAPIKKKHTGSNRNIVYIFTEGWLPKNQIFINTEWRDSIDLFSSIAYSIFFENFFGKKQTFLPGFC